MYKHALSCLGMGDSQSWRKAVNGICETPGLSESGDNAGLALWACALAGDGFADYARVLDLARAAATRTNGANPARDVLTLGALLYRAGRYPEALQKLNEAAELRVKTGSEQMSPAYAFYFLAMTQARLGHGSEAQDAFRRGLAFDPAAGGTVRATEPNPPWNRRLTLNLLRSEAEEEWSPIRQDKALQLPEAKEARRGTRHPPELGPPGETTLAFPAGLIFNPVSPSGAIRG